MSLASDADGETESVSTEIAAQLLSAVGQAVVATSLDGTVVYWNRAAERLYGWSATQAIGSPLGDLLSVTELGEGDELDRGYFAAVRAGGRRSVEVELESRDRRRTWIRVAHSPIVDPAGKTVGIIGISHDISVRRAREAALAASETRFRALVQRSTDVAVIVGLDGILQYLSPTVVDMLGFEPHELVGANGWDLVHPDDLDALVERLAAIARLPGAHLTAECRLRTVDGSYRWIEQTITNLLDEPAVNGIVANLRDVSDRKVIEADLNHRVLHDELTGLPNRAHLDQELARALAGTDGAAALVFDIDQFKLINDSHGHTVGDELLSQVSARLRHALRPGDLAGRFGGDEFVVICRGIGDTDHAELIAERLQSSLRAPFQLSGVGPVFVTASVGIAVGAPGSSPEELFHDADAAMYEAKRGGRARHAVYDDAMRSRATRRLRIESELRHALDAGQIVPFFQPIVELGTGLMVGAEALARWNHPTRGLLGPPEFIGVAEESGLIIELDRAMLSLALGAASRWAKAGHPLLVAINLSTKQLNDPGLVTLVDDAIVTAGIAPGMVSFEVTETAVMTDPKRSIAVVQELAALGVNLALDDFGTGYSSLAYLKQLPVTTVKIDRGFVAGVDTRPDDRDIVAAIIHLANAFGRFLVAEGVETVGQMEALRDLGCPHAQGYYWSRPVEESAFLELVRTGFELPSGSQNG